MAEEKKEPTKAERCKAIGELLEKRRDVLEISYIDALEKALAGHDNVSQDAVQLLDAIQELDEHIAEMQKQSKAK